MICTPLPIICTETPRSRTLAEGAPERRTRSLWWRALKLILITSASLLALGCFVAGLAVATLVAALSLGMLLLAAVILAVGVVPMGVLMILWATKRMRTQ